MTGNAIAATSEALELRGLSSEELNAVSGGFMRLPLVAFALKLPTAGTSGGENPGGGQNDPAQMFQQIMQQLTQGG